MKTTFNKKIKNFNKTIAHLVKAYKVILKKTKKKSKIAILNMNLNQTLNLWIEFLNDLKIIKVEKQESEVAKQAKAKKLIKIQQANMMKPAVKQRK